MDPMNSKFARSILLKAIERGNVSMISDYEDVVPDLEALVKLLRLLIDDGYFEVKNNSIVKENNLLFLTAKGVNAAETIKEVNAMSEGRLFRTVHYRVI